MTYIEVGTRVVATCPFTGEVIVGRVVTMGPHAGGGSYLVVRSETSGFEMICLDSDVETAPDSVVGGSCDVD